MGDFDSARGFAGASPGQELSRVLERLTRRDLETIIGPRVLPLLPDAGGRSALLAAATRSLQDRPLAFFADPVHRKTLLRNLDSGKLDELRHRLGDTAPAGPVKDIPDLAEPQRWRAAAGFFGLEAEEAAAAPTALPHEEVTPYFGLFPHQRSVVRRAFAIVGNGAGRTLIHMPTGAGKTRTAMHLIAKALNETQPGLVVWLASSRELLEQAADTFVEAWGPLGNRPIAVRRFWGAYPRLADDLDDGLLVAGLGKLHALRERDPADFLRLSARVRLVVMDEAHQAIAPTYRQLIDDLCGAGAHGALLGLTATPGRSWNDVVADEQLSTYFGGSKVVLEAGDDPNPVRYLLEQGYLATPEFRQIEYAPPAADALPPPSGATEDFADDVLESVAGDTDRNRAILGAVGDLIARGHQRIILFAASVEHAEDLTAALTAHGVAAAMVSGETPLARRAAVLRTFRGAGATPMVVCNFGVLTTGFDAPRTSAAIIARPTKSLVLFSQMVGRATRGPKAGGTVLFSHQMRPFP